ncbi:MAG: Mut7-C RNAse domain-containing protein [Desulfobacterales bacterium]
MSLRHPCLCRFRFYATLNDFLPRRRRGIAFNVRFSGRKSVKSAIEGAGVPHTEVDLVLVNGESVGFGRPLVHGDRVSVYPVFQRIDISPLVKLSPDLPGTMRFVIDGHLGKLAKAMRLLGFDCLYDVDLDDAEIVRRAFTEGRIILTRDIQLLKRQGAQWGTWVRSTDPEWQVREVLDRFGLRSQCRPFTRCLACGGELREADRDAVAPRLEPRTARFYRRFFECARCGQVFWEGSHYRRLAKRAASWIGKRG